MPVTFSACFVFILRPGPSGDSYKQVAMKKIAIFLLAASAAVFSYAQQPDDLNALYAKANARLEEGAYKNAIIDYNQLVNSNFSDGHVFLKRGIAQFHLEAYQMALQDFDLAYRQQLREPELIGYRGMAKYKLDDLSGAGSDLEQAIVLGFENGEAFYMLGNIRYRESRFIDAIKYYDAAEKAGTNTAVLFNNRGKSKTELGRNDAAIADFTKALNADNTYTTSYRNRAEAYIKLEQWEKAIDDLNKLGDRSEAGDLLNRGKVNFRLENFDEAVSDLQRAEAKGISGNEIYPLLADSYFAKGDYSKAAAFYDKLVRADASNLAAWEKLGISLYSDKQFSQSEKALTEAINRGGTTKESFGYRGMARFRMDKKEEAYEDLSRVSTMGFTNEDAYYFLGELLIQKEQYEPAIAQLNKGIALNPEKCGAYAARARAFSALDKHDLAIKDIRKALSLDNDPDLWMISGQIHFDAGKYREALTELERAVQNGFKDPSVHLLQANAWYELKDYANALEKYNAAAGQGAVSNDIQYRIAECNYHNGSLDKAYEAFRKAEAGSAVPQALQYAYAHSAFNEKQYAKVVSLLSGKPEIKAPVESFMMLAVSHFELNQYQAALDASVRASKNEAIYRIGGLSAYNLKQNDKAIEMLALAVPDEEVMRISAELYLAGNDPVNAERCLTWLIDNGFAEADYHVSRATIRMEAGNDEKALADIKEALQIDANRNDARMMRAGILLKQGDHARAIEDLRILDAAGYEKSRTAYLLGTSLIETGQRQEARPYLEKAYQNGSREIPLLREIGKFEFEDANFDRAAEMFSLLLQKEDDARVRSLRGQAYFQLENYEKAISDLSEVECNSFGEWSALGRSYYELDRHTDAASALAAAFKINPEHAETAYLLGNSRFRTEDFRGAIDSYLKSAAAGYGEAVLFNNLGKAYEQVDSREDAISAYNRALEIDPEYERARQNRGEALFLQGNYKGAIEDLSLVTDKKNERVNYYIAESHSRLGDHKMALTYYNRAIDAGRKDGEIYHKRGRTYLELEQVAPALADLNLALQAGNKDADVYLDRARANIYMNNERAAMADLNEAIAKDDKNALAFYNRAYLKEIQENYQEAISDYKKVIFLDPDDDKAYYSLANSMVSVGNVGGALEPIDQAIQLNASDPAYFKVKGNILYRIGKEDDACSFWKKAVDMGDGKSSFYIDQYCK